MGLLVDYGYQLVDTMEESDLVIINSCTVKNPSEQSFLLYYFSESLKNKFRLVSQAK